MRYSFYVFIDIWRSIESIPYWIQSCTNRTANKNRSCVEIIAVAIDEGVYELNIFDEKDICAKKKKDSAIENQEQQEELEVPDKLVWGVSLALAGVFLMAIPLPGFSSAGLSLFTAGFAMAGDVIAITRDERKNQEDHD